MIFKHTIRNNFSQNPRLLFATILNKIPPLAQSWQNMEISNLSSGRQATVGPTLAESADDVTNNKTTMQPTANVSPTEECYLGIFQHISGAGEEHLCVLS